jgi:hypothetical protein
MNPTTQVIKRFCCTLSSGRCSRCLHAARVFARAASLQLDTQTVLLSMTYFAEARTLGGWLGRGRLFTALKCRMQRCSWGETAAFWRGAFQRKAPQPTTRRLEILTRVGVVGQEQRFDMSMDVAHMMTPGLGKPQGSLGTLCYLTGYGNIIPVGVSTGTRYGCV